VTSSLLLGCPRHGDQRSGKPGYQIRPEHGHLIMSVGSGWGSTMTATQTTTTIAISSKHAVCFSLFHHCGRHGIGPSGSAHTALVAVAVRPEVLWRILSPPADSSLPISPSDAQFYRLCPAGLGHHRQILQRAVTSREHALTACRHGNPQSRALPRPACRWYPQRQQQQQQRYSCSSSCVQMKSTDRSS